MKILVINPFGIGDVLFSTPVISAIKKKFPDCFLAYLCNKQCAPILENNPNVDELMFYSRGDLKKIRRRSFIDYLKTFGRAVTKIKRTGFDIVVDLSMVMQYSLVLKLLQVPKRYGFNYKDRGRFLTDQIDINTLENKHIVDYYADLLELLGIDQIPRKLDFYLSEKDLKWAESFLKDNDITRADTIVGMAAFGGLSWGADAQSKQWPVDSYFYISRNIIEKHRVKVLFFGTKKDKQSLKLTAELNGFENFVDVVGKTTLGQLAALISKCSLFVSNDSGPLHIACALGIDTVSIYGPVDEKIYGPVGDANKHNIVCADIDCRPCYHDFQKPVCSTMDCLKKLTRENVLSAVEKSLARITRQ